MIRVMRAQILNVLMSMAALVALACRQARIDAFLADGNIMDAQADGLVATYGDRIKVKAYMGKASDDTDFDVNNVIATKTIANRYYGGEVSGNLGDSLNLAAGYVKFQDVMGRDSG